MLYQKERGDSRKKMKEENKDIIDKLFSSIEKRVKDHHEESYNLSKGSRIRHQNGRIIDIFLIALSNNTATISFVDRETKVEISTVDILDKDLRHPNLTYKEACEIYDEILERSEVVIVDLKKHQ